MTAEHTATRSRRSCAATSYLRATATSVRAAPPRGETDQDDDRESQLARSTAESIRWRRDFIRTFLERDLPQLDVRTPASALHRFWSMLAHVHAQTLNWSELGRSMGISDTTVRSYVDILEGALVGSTLKPWHENISKRQVKAPKVFVRDSGLLHSLLDIESLEQLDQCYYWATHAGAELDLLVVAGQHRRGYEFKLGSPGTTASMRVALDDLRLDSLDVIHSGRDSYPLADRIRAVAATRILEDIAPL